MCLWVIMEPDPQRLSESYYRSIGSIIGRASSQIFLLDYWSTMSRKHTSSIVLRALTSIRSNN